jgi:hypothetical protein
MYKAINNIAREAFAEVKRESEWRDVTRAEIYIYLGILCYNGVYKLLDYLDY